MASKSTPSSYKMDPELRLRLKVHLMKKGVDISEFFVQKALEELGREAEDPSQYPIYQTNQHMPVGSCINKSKTPEFVDTQKVTLYVDKALDGWIKSDDCFVKVVEHFGKYGMME